MGSEEFALITGPSYGGSNEPIVDSMEIYGSTKEEFGWISKVETLIKSVSDQSKSKDFSETIQNPTQRNVARLLSVLETTNKLNPFSKELSEKLKQSVVALLSSTNSSQPSQLAISKQAKSLFLSLQPDQLTYYDVCDSLVLNGILKQLSNATTTNNNVNHSFSQLKSILKQLRKIISFRTHHFVDFIIRNPQLTSLLIDSFVSTIGLISDNSVEQLLNGLTEILYKISMLTGSDVALNFLGSLLTPNTTTTTTPTTTTSIKFVTTENFRILAAKSLCSLILGSAKSQVQHIQTVKEREKQAGIVPPQKQGNNNKSQPDEEFVCNKCEKGPIFARYSCDVCKDFDLCEDCHSTLKESFQSHTTSHSMTFHADTRNLEKKVEQTKPIELPPPNISVLVGLEEEQLLEIAVKLSLETQQPQQIDLVKLASQTNSQRSKTISFCVSLIEQLTTQTYNALFERHPDPSQLIPSFQVIYSLITFLSVSLATNSFANVKDEVEKLRKLFSNTILKHLSMPLPTKPTPEVLQPILQGLILSVSLSSSILSIPTRVELISNRLSDSDILNHSPLSEISSTFAQILATTMENNNNNNLVISNLQKLLKSSIESLENEANNKQQGGNVSFGGSLLNPTKYEVKVSHFLPFFADGGGLRLIGRSLQTKTSLLMLQSLLKFSFDLQVLVWKQSGIPSVQVEELKKETTTKQSTTTTTPTPPTLFEKEWQFQIASSLNILAPQKQDKLVETVRKEAKEFLMLICNGNKSQFHEMRDFSLFEKHIQQVRVIYSTSDGAMNYDQTVQTVEHLSHCVQLAQRRPLNWKKFCASSVDVVRFILQIVLNSSEETTVASLKLLALAFSSSSSTTNETKETKETKEKEKEKSKTTATTTDSMDVDKTDTNPLKSQIDSLLKGRELLSFARNFMLSNKAEIRKETKTILSCIWIESDSAQKTRLFALFCSVFHLLPSNGRNAKEYVEFVVTMVNDVLKLKEQTTHKEALNSLTQNITKTMKLINQVIAAHPNSYLYNSLSRLVDFSGYYLESKPCLVCNDREAPFEELKFSDSKYTDSCVIMKLERSFSIQSVTLMVNDMKKAKMIRTINFYYNNKPVAELSELKKNWAAWKKAKTIEVPSPTPGDIKIDFPIPITCCNVLIE